MDTHPSSSRPLAQALLLLVLVMLAALALFLAMRVVTPMRDAMAPVPSTPSMPATLPTSTPPSTAPTAPPAGEPVRPPAGTSPSPQVRPRPANAICDAQNFICVSAPLANDVIGNPTVATGTAIAFENTFAWELLDARGTQIAAGSATADAPDVGQPGPFELRFFWDVQPRTATGTFHAYETSARDGSPIHDVRVPVRFSSRAQASRRLFFVSDVVSPEADCTVVQSVELTVPGTALPIEATLRALLAVGSGETPPGLKTMIPDGTRLVSLSVNNGLAKAVFDAGLEREGVDACRAGAIRNQIRKTLLQFPSVQQVDISVEGKTPEDTLRP